MRRMKRIKLFESFENNYYYQRLDSSEMNWDTIYFDSFTEKDIRIIYDLVSKTRASDINWDNFEVQNQPRTNKPNYRVDISVDDTHISIRALKDEWFLAEMVNSSEFPRKTTFYKCDQLDGLLEFLKDILYI